MNALTRDAVVAFAESIRYPNPKLFCIMPKSWTDSAGNRHSIHSTSKYRALVLSGAIPRTHSVYAHMVYMAANVDFVRLNGDYSELIYSSSETPIPEP